MQFQKINIFAPIMADKVGPAPVVINALITPNKSGYAECVPGNQQKIEQYVLLSVLPEELRRRVELAVQTLLTAL
jgi:hypothetical protein